MTDFEIYSRVKSCAEEVKKHLCKGYLEAVYRKALLYELSKNGLSVKEEVALEVNYKDTVVGIYRADLIVEDRFIIELKAQMTLTRADSMQLVNYLHTTRVDYGVLINFGSDLLQFYPKSRVYPQPDWLSKI